MRKLSIILLFLAFNTFLNAQSDFFLKLKKALKEDHPEINLENRLLAINIWSANDQESREVNKQLSKTYKIYEFAKLKGGLKGLIGIAINKDGNAASILLSKDDATKLIQLNTIDLSGLGTTSNIVFDCDGNEVYKNIKSEKVFESINKLITR